VEDEKEDLKSKVEILQDQVEQLNDEIVIEKSRSDKLRSDNQNYKDKLETALRCEEDLQSKVGYLEEKLERQMNELNAIESNHHKTKLKLREIIRQAETDITKANREKETMSANLRSLQDQLHESETKLAMLESDQKSLHEDLRRSRDENETLRKSLNLGPSKSRKYRNNNNNNSNNTNSGGANSKSNKLFTAI